VLHLGIGGSDNRDIEQHSSSDGKSEYAAEALGNCCRFAKHCERVHCCSIE
jgi:hypothetical protein